MTRKILNIKPLHTNILVRGVAERGVALGGTAPMQAQKKPVIAVVAEVSDNYFDGKYHPSNLTVGDTVLFNQWNGTEVLVDGAEHLIIAEKDVLGIAGVEEVEEGGE